MISMCNKIQLIVTAEEAEVMLSALTHWVGYYHPQDKLTQEEEARTNRAFTMREQMCSELQETLLDRGQRREEYEEIVRTVLRREVSTK